MIILFYPDCPPPSSRLYQALKDMNISFHNDPLNDNDITFKWENLPSVYDTQTFFDNPTQVVNGLCLDVDKSSVDEVFSSRLVKPEVYQGVYVMKSDSKSSFVPKTFISPRQREIGFVYQEYFDTRDDNGLYKDYRIFWSGQIDMIIAKFKYSPFNSSVFKCEVVDNILGPVAIEKISLQIEEFGLDFGEVDFIIDNTGAPVVIGVDVNPNQSLFRYVSAIHWGAYKTSVRDFFANWFLDQNKAEDKTIEI